jgi:hypothetical protein
MLDQAESLSENGLWTTLEYLRRLFVHGIDPNLVTWGTTLFTIFSRVLTKYSLGLTSTCRSLLNEILDEFL